MRIRLGPWLGWFAVAGVLLPLCFCVHVFVFHGMFSSFEQYLWPSSIMLMALDSPEPEPLPTVVGVFLIVILENVLVYVVVGAALWLCVAIVARGVAALRAKSQ